MSGFAVVCLNQVYMSSLGIFIDSFMLVRHQVGVMFHSRQNVSMASQTSLLSLDGLPVTLADGRKVSADSSIKHAKFYDLIHIPGFIAGNLESLQQRLETSQEFLAWLRQQYAEGAIISASGTAVFFLAEAGLLDHGIAAVLRPLIPGFRQRYPQIRIEHQRSVVEFERIVTGKGMATEAQLVTRLIERITTPELARWLNDVTGMVNIADEHLAEDTLVANAQLWLEERFADDVKIASLAAAMAVSQQTLLRHFRRHLNTTPQGYLRQLRIHSAKGLLEKTSRSVEEIASLVGYNDAPSFRKVFREITGTSASKYRKEKKQH